MSNPALRRFEAEVAAEKARLIESGIDPNVAALRAEQSIIARRRAAVDSRIASYSEVLL